MVEGIWERGCSGHAAILAISLHVEAGSRHQRALEGMRQDSVRQCQRLLVRGEDENGS